jgi:hypothetical protein
MFERALPGEFVVSDLRCAGDQSRFLADELLGGAMTSTRIPRFRKTSHSKPAHARSRAARDALSPIRTLGELFPTGGGIDLLRDAATGGLTLILFNERDQFIASRHKSRGRDYLPAELEPSFRRAIILPSTCAEFGSTLALFAAVRASFTAYGFSEEVALTAGYFVFSSWFPDCLPAAPCLCVTGPRAEASLLLQLLACMARHPLRLGEIARSALCSLPFDLQLTLLIDHEPTSRSAWNLLAISNDRGALISWKNRLINPFCAKAIYRGLALDEDHFDGIALHINVPPSRGPLPILDAQAQREIAEKLQPQLQTYRCRNISKVRESRIDFPEFESPLRILGRILGAAIIDAPALQADLEPVLRGLEEGARAERWHDLRCVTIESLLSLAHFGGNEKVHIGQITLTAGAILKGRGETASFEPEIIGAIVRQLGFKPKRDNKGNAIHLSDQVRRRIHELARDYDVAAVQQGVAVCPLCLEILPAADPAQVMSEDAEKDDTAEKGSP